MNLRYRTPYRGQVLPDRHRGSRLDWAVSNGLVSIVDLDEISSFLTNTDFVLAMQMAETVFTEDKAKDSVTTVFLRGGRHGGVSATTWGAVN